MSLKSRYLGQQVADAVPDVVITGDPSVDGPVLLAAGYAAGVICALKTSATAGRGVVVYPMDGATLTELAFGTLLNGPGNYAESIGVSGSGKTPVTRQMPIFELYNEVSGPKAYDDSLTYLVGQPLYADKVANQAGRWTNAIPVASAPVLGIVLHAPSTAEPWLTVAQTF